MTCFILSGLPSIILLSLSFFTEITSDTNFTEAKSSFFTFFLLIPLQQHRVRSSVLRLDYNICHVIQVFLVFYPENWAKHLCRSSSSASHRRLGGGCCIYFLQAAQHGKRLSEINSPAKREGPHMKHDPLCAQVLAGGKVCLTLPIQDDTRCSS